MNTKKNVIINTLALVMTIGIYALYNMNLHALKDVVSSFSYTVKKKWLISPSLRTVFYTSKINSISQNISGYERIQGTLVKKEWAKSFESYCSQGGDYFTLVADSEELVLDFWPPYSESQMTKFSGKNIAIIGAKKQREIKCPKGSQCPLTPDNIFRCEVFKVVKIIPIDNTSEDCLACLETGWRKLSSKKCPQETKTKEGVKNCLLSFDLPSINQTTDITEIIEGYIDMGGMEIMNSPTRTSIGVFVWHQFAVDTAGNFYWLMQ